jgi:N-acetylneuraminic acid mutarotase
MSFFLPRWLGFALFLFGAGALGSLCEAGLTGFEETGSMVGSGANTATLLSNGKVLVIHRGSAELYDPASRTWTSTGSLNQARASYTATLLANGKVLVAGGAGGAVGLNDFDSAELYDPASGTWTFTGSMNNARRSHTATLLPDGKVLVAGGFFDIPNSILQSGSPLSSAELYDPASGTWRTTGQLVDARYDQTATLLSDGRVLVAGGRAGPSRYGPSIATAELYDPASGTWTATGSLNTARRFHTATLLPDGKVLVTGGIDSHVGYLASAELYDPQIGTWTPTSDLSTVRVSHTATLLPTGKVLVVGGFNSSGRDVASAELFDPSSGSWAATGSLITARAGHTATLLNDGTVLVAGGSYYDGATNTSLSSAELYGKRMPTLLNISTRTNVRTGDKVLIGGFTITGTERKTVIVRGIGPSLTMAGVLADPVIEVHGPSGELLASNDNWRQAATSQQISDSGLAPSDELESALWGVINPGTYTVILSGKDGGTGVGSVEVYDLDEPADSRLANISTRGFVDTGDNVMIGGLIVGGGTPSGGAKVVVRALGPSIPVADALANPTVELYDENGTSVAFNDDWKTRPDGSSQQAEIEATGIPPSNDLESAFVKILSPGSYTAIVRGKDNTTGIGLVEVYHLP